MSSPCRLVATLMLAFPVAMASGEEPVTSETPDYGAIVKAVQDLHASASKAWLDRYKTARKLDPADVQFNPSRYFEVLKHLSMDDGAMLDCVYWVRGGNGRPYLYVRKAEDGRYATYEAYEKGVGGPAIVTEKDRSRDFMDEVHLDGTAAGYFEFVVLRELGGQFCLAWHGGYNDFKPVTGSDDVENVIQGIEKDAGAEKLSDDQKRKARSIDAKPEVRMLDENQARVALTVFSKWGGFIRKTYTIRRTFPHKVEGCEFKYLVKYACGYKY